MDPQKFMLGTVKLLCSRSLYTGVKWAAPVPEVVQNLISEARDGMPLQGVRMYPTPGAFVRQKNMVRLDFYENSSGGRIEKRLEGVATNGGMVPTQF